MVTILIGAVLSILACWGLARARRGRVHDATCLIPHDLRGLLDGPCVSRKIHVLTYDEMIEEVD